MENSITQRSSVTFKRAQKSAAYLRMGLAGPSGSGKTYTALLLASELAAGKGVAVIDTERGSASKYSDIFTFDVVELDNFHPDHYIEAIKAAQEAGYGALVIDSLSHAWNATGGLLEQHENAVKRQKMQNSYTAWAEITPIQNRLINAITGAGLHVIATMRSKTEYVIETQNGKSSPRKVGMAPIQRDGMEYEFDVFAEMDAGNTMLVQKSRCQELSDATIGKPGKGVADILRMWLRGSDGVLTPPSPSPPPPVADLPDPTPIRKGVEPEHKSIEQLEKELKDRALKLGLTEEQYDQSRKHHGTYAATAAALNTYEEKQKHIQEITLTSEQRQELRRIAAPLMLPEGELNQIAARHGNNYKQIVADLNGLVKASASTAGKGNH